MPWLRRYCIEEDKLYQLEIDEATADSIRAADELLPPEVPRAGITSERQPWPLWTERNA